MPAAHEQVRLANVALVRRFIEAINDSWNIEAMRELVSDDFLFLIPFAPDWFQVRHQGKETRMKSTNLPYRNEYIGRFRIREGKITVFAAYLDPTRFVIAMVGAVVPPPTTTSSG